MANVRREGRIGIGLSVEPELDKRKAASVVRDVLNLQKKLGPLKLSWDEIAKRSHSSVREIREMSAAAASFAKNLSAAAKSSFKELSSLGDELEDATQAAAALKERYASAKGEPEKKQITKQLSEVSKVISNLNKQIEDHKKTSYKYGTELKQLTKTQRDYQKKLESAADYTPKDAFKNIIASIAKGAGGGVGGVKGAVAGAGQAAVSGVAGGVARKGLAAEAGGMESIVGTLGKAAGILGGVAMALGAVWKFIAAASEHQTKLNKALLEGTGFVNDFTSDTKQYRAVIDDLRGASQDAAYSLLRFGGNSETAAKAINSFAKESTGSLIQTRAALISLGKGDVKAGVEEFARNAMVYGKALGMETDEVAGMMGKFISETGYGADQVQGLMGNIVKAAATSNMPMTKFMGIFKQVLPDVELYQNRLEELTGTIKLLSKTMSPKDVKNFMESFAKGFQGMDFKQRLKTVLIAGTGFVSKTLGKDFDMKAKAMAQNFEKYATPDMGKFEDAMKGGESSMAKYISKAQSNAAKQGAEITGTQIGDAMKLASYEAARKKGGPLNVATAMKGAGVYSTYKILNKFGQTLTTGFDGLSEHVMKQLGISEQQYDALRTTSQSLKLQRTQLQQYGKTTSKSMNKSLRETIAMRKGIKADNVTQKDMQNASDEDLFQAAEMSNTMKEGQQTAQDMAQEQVSATMSISEKIDNVIAFLLEKLYKVVQPILDVLDKIFDWITGSDDARLISKEMDRLMDKMDKGGKSGAEKEQFKMVAEEIKKATMAGKSGDDLADSVAKNGVIQADLLKDNLQAVSKMGMDLGMNERDALKVQVKMERALAAGDMTAALKTLEDLPGDLAINIAGLGSRIGAGTEAERRAGEKETFQRGPAKVKVFKTQAEKEAAAQAADLESNLEEIGQNTKAASQSQQEMAAGVTSGPTRMGTTVVTPGAPPGGATPPDQGGVVAEGVKGVQDASEDHAEAALKQNEQVYDGITSVADILKKGIKFEQSWFGTKWKNTMKDATLDSFRKALLEFAVLQATMADNANLQKAIAGHGEAILQSGKTATDIIHGHDAPGNWEDYISQSVLGSKQTGGPIPDTGMYKLHKGEYVVPAMPASKGGGGGGNVHANITINGTSLSPQQLEGAVYGAMDKLARKH